MSPGQGRRKSAQQQSGLLLFAACCHARRLDAQSQNQQRPPNIVVALSRGEERAMSLQAAALAVALFPLLLLAFLRSRRRKVRHIRE